MGRNMAGRRGKNSEMPDIKIGHAIDRCDVSEGCSVLMWITRFQMSWCGDRGVVM